MSRNQNNERHVVLVGEVFRVSSVQVELLYEVLTESPQTLDRGVGYIPTRYPLLHAVLVRYKDSGI